MYNYNKLYSYIIIKAWEAQLVEHGFEATGAVSSSLTSSKLYNHLKLIKNSLYSSTVERNTVNILIYVQFILRA